MIIDAERWINELEAQINEEGCPWEIQEINLMLINEIQARYDCVDEESENKGKLLKLPCAVGDTVYRICPKCNDAHDGSCKNCAWEGGCSSEGCTVYGGWKDGQYPADKCTIVPYKVFWNYIPNLLENMGKRVFLTREEAEAALKNM